MSFTVSEIRLEHKSKIAINLNKLKMVSVRAKSGEIYVLFAVSVSLIWSAKTYAMQIMLLQRLWSRLIRSQSSLPNYSVALLNPIQQPNLQRLRHRHRLNRCLPTPPSQELHPRRQTARQTLEKTLKPSKGQHRRRRSHKSCPMCSLALPDPTQLNHRRRWLVLVVFQPRMLQRLVLNVCVPLTLSLVFSVSLIRWRAAMSSSDWRGELLKSSKWNGLVRQRKARNSQWNYTTTVSTYFYNLGKFFGWSTCYHGILLCILLCNLPL